jgi:phospholipid transport system substrate-binding protein
MKSMLRTAALVLALGIPLNCLADTPESAPVTALNAALLATMKAGSAGASFQARYNALYPVVQQSFDMPVVEQNSVGFLWSTIPPAQQQQLATAFDQWTVATYVNQFSSYSGEQIELLPDEKTLGDKKIVETQIVPANGSAPTELDYVVADGPAGWQITDVLLNGTISQVAVHSSDFSSLVSAGDASQLISALKAKTVALSSDPSSGHQ